MNAIEARTKSTAVNSLKTSSEYMKIQNENFNGG